MKYLIGISFLILSFSSRAQHHDPPQDTARQPMIRLFRPQAVAPLYIVDKKEITEKELSLISAEDIERMEVLHGVSAIERYGEKAKNGVIIITMKEQGSPRQKTVPQDTSALPHPVALKTGAPAPRVMK